MTMILSTRRSPIAAEIQRITETYEVHDSVIAEWRQAEATVARARDRIRVIRESREYTPEGKMARVVAVRDEVGKTFDPIRSTVERHRKVLAEIKAKLVGPPPAPSLEEMLIDRELRDIIRTKCASVAATNATTLPEINLLTTDTVRVDQVHRDAVTAGDVATQRAIERSPVPMLSPAYFGELTQSRLAASEDYQRIATDLDCHESILQAAVHELNAAVADSE